MSLTTKRLLYLCGNILAVLGLFFIGWKLWQWRDTLSLAMLSSKILVSSLLLCLLSAANGATLSFAWREILASFNADVSIKNAINIQGISQLAKYVPGNVVHYLARQTMGRSFAVSHKILAISTFLELALIGGVCIVYAIPLLAYLNLMEKLSFLSFLHISLLPSLVIVCIASSICCLILRKWRGVHLFRSILYYYIFVGIMGFVFVVIVVALADRAYPIDLLILFFCAAVVAYFLGLVTPGAPSGIGVREAVLIFILQNIVEPQVVIMAVLLWRCVTVIGDVVFYAIATTLIIPEKNNC